MTSDSTPAFEIEKEALKTEIETGIQAGVDHLEAKTAKRKDADKYHNTRHLLKQYRKVAYAIQISEADMNVRMEMEHGTRLSTLEVNAELAGVDLSGSKLEGYARTVIRSKNMLQIIDNALNTVRMDPDHGELMYQVLYLTYFSKKKPANREVILAELDRQGFPMSMVKKDVVTRTNTLRLNKGVAVLEVNNLLMDAAQVRADEMAASGAYSHTRPDGRRSNTVTDSRRTGENIHCITELYLEQQHKTLSDAVVNLWSNSKGHADNMLNARYGEIGVGLARGTDSNGLACWYCVQVFLVDGCEVTWVDVPAIG